MKRLQTATVVNHSIPATINNGDAIIANQIDTHGFRGGELLVVCQFGAIHASATFDSISLQSSDASGSGFADVTGCVVGTSTLADSSGTSVNFAGGDDDGASVVFHVSLDESQKRYFQVSVSESGSQAVVISAVALILPGGTDIGTGLVTSATTGAGHQQVLIAS
tara:strand:+ start:3804 stop:4298 length:495 start_codon:yes stop_codon:yes gene_type:complete